MSSYESSSTTIVVTPTNQELLLEFLTANLGQACTWNPSCEIQAARHAVAAATSTEEVQSALAPLRITTNAERFPLLVSASVASTGNTMVATTAIDSELNTLWQASRRAERDAVSTLTRRALVSRGFTVRDAVNDHTAAIEARRGHSVLLVGVTDGGAVEMDWAGHDGASCEAEVAELREALAAEGLQLDIRRVERHANRAGGSMIANAARRGNGDLVAGLLGSNTQRGQAGQSPRQQRNDNEAPARLREGETR